MRELTEIYCQRACNDGLLKYFYLSQNRKSLQHFILTSKDSCSFDVRTCFQESVMTAGYNGYYRVPWSRTDRGQIPAAGQVLYPLQAWIYSSCLPQRIVVKIKWDFFSPHSDLQIVRFQNVSSHYDCVIIIIIIIMVPVWTGSTVHTGASVVSSYDTAQNPSNQWGTRGYWGRATGIWFVFPIMYFHFSFYFFNTHLHILHIPIHTWF